ncbi:MAG TPA: hypothetical protein VHQ24_03645, partial [Lachnospiraceae bacterium]|nr:hypothetical protein [Lachnospiraceae bacterium]
MKSGSRFVKTLFQDQFKELKKADVPIYKVPKSIQQCIDVVRIAEDGIFEIPGGKYTKTYRFKDINYVTNPEEEQVSIFELYCKLLNSLDIPFKITINNRNKNMKTFRKKILYAHRKDGYDTYRDCFNQEIERRIMEGKQGIKQEKLLTVVIQRKNYEEAKVFFHTLENNINIQFMELGSSITSLNANERLRILHNFYRMGEEETFDIDVNEYIKRYEDWKNDVCCSSIKFNAYDFETDRKKCRVMFIRKYPSALSDQFLCELANLPVNCMISIDVIPIPKDSANKLLDKKYMGIEMDIGKQQRVRNKNNDFSSDISYSKRAEKKEIESIMNDVRENDQMIFYVGVSLLFIADDMEELERNCSSATTVIKKHCCEVDTYYLQQREA